MTFPIGSSGVALQYPVVLLNISFIVPRTFVPILMFYEIGGAFFDLQTVSIPFLHVHFETLQDKPSSLYGRISLSGTRLRSQVCAYGGVGLEEAALTGKIHGKSENLCFGYKCSSIQTEETQRAIGSTKVTFGPEFNMFFHNIFVSPEKLFYRITFYASNAVVRQIGMGSVTLFFKVTNSYPTGLHADEAKFVCLVCDGNWESNYVLKRTTAFKSYVFSYHGGQSFWNGIQQVSGQATTHGTHLHWSYEYSVFYDFDRWSQGSCEAYAQFVQQRSIHDFSPIYRQFVFTVIPVRNSTIVTQECANNEYFDGGRFGLRFHQSTTKTNTLDLSDSQNFPESFDEAFMFITDQNVTSKRYAADLYLKAFDIDSWIAVLVAGGVTCGALAMLVKTWKMRRMRSFWDSMRYLCAFFLDQCPSALPFPDAVVRSKKALLFVVVPWMMTILILSNGLRGVMKSNYVNKFPYETTLHNWEDFKEFQLYTLVKDDFCETNTDEKTVNEASIWWAVNGRQSKDWCYNGKPEQPTFLMKPSSESGFQQHTINDWLIVREFEELSNDSMRCNHGCDYNHPTAVCVRNFSQYSGSTYHYKVSKLERIAKKILKFQIIWMADGYETLLPCDSSINTKFRLGRVNSRNYLYAFWMTRRHESAWVIRKSEFPWYWNLFKKAMVNDSRVQFAHTGGSEVLRKTKHAIYERNDAPFYIFVRHRYMEPANWMIRRIAAIQESGILNLWFKWDTILRPPVNESLNEEVSETFDEVRELRLADPGITFLFKVAASLMLISMTVFTLEIVISI